MKLTEELRGSMRAYPVMEDLVTALRSSQMPMTQIAHKAGVSDSTFSNIRNGVLPSIPTLSALAGAMGFEVRFVPLGAQRTPFEIDWPTGTGVRIEHDGFTGTVIGHYRRLDGYQGAVVQQDGTRVVHVYGERWLRRKDESK